MQEAKPVSKALATANKFISRYNNGMQHRNSSVGSGLDGSAAAEGSEDEVGQLVEIMFQAPLK